MMQLDVENMDDKTLKKAIVEAKDKWRASGDGIVSDILKEEYECLLKEAKKRNLTLSREELLDFILSSCPQKSWFKTSR
ncbi:MAG: DUF2508 domain-containing protein [Xylanivirga thermophila]|jgi:hypothetical protein|uniref:hypothetical protein n=1 Tax=Xylanivirga thermophila TaxID=2496273 RepID=UPI00101C7127|nr:hypothetical protein [Xylanivirga thermophila]